MQRLDFRKFIAFLPKGETDGSPGWVPPTLGMDEYTRRTSEGGAGNGFGCYSGTPFGCARSIFYASPGWEEPTLGYHPFLPSGEKVYRIMNGYLDAKF